MCHAPCASKARAPSSGAAAARRREEQQQRRAKRPQEAGARLPRCLFSQYTCCAADTPCIPLQSAPAQDPSELAAELKAARAAALAVNVALCVMRLVRGRTHPEVVEGEAMLSRLKAGVAELKELLEDSGGG
jgi:7-keto-8-aminopelargonate synthetase-like enzyme